MLTIQAPRILCFVKLPKKKRGGERARLHEHTSARRSVAPTHVGMKKVLSGFHGEQLCRELSAVIDKPEEKDRFVAEGGHRVLISMLSTGSNSKAAELASIGLVNLSLRDQGRKSKLVNDGIAVPVVELLREPPTAKNKTAILGAVSLVNNLALTSVGCEAFQKERAISPLSDLLACKFGDVAAKAAGALCNLSYDSEGGRRVNHQEMHEHGVVAKLVPLLKTEAANRGCALIRNLSDGTEAIAAFIAAGAIQPIVALLYSEDTSTSEMAAAALHKMIRFDDSRAAVGVIVTELGFSPCLRTGMRGRATQSNRRVSLLVALRRPTLDILRMACESTDDVTQLQRVITAAESVGVDDGELRHACARLVELKDAAERARTNRRRMMGIDESGRRPDEFYCPITLEVMEDPVVVSDGHTYERKAIEKILWLSEEMRKSPLTRETLKPHFFLNRALKSRISGYDCETEAFAIQVAKNATSEVQSGDSRKRKASVSETLFHEECGSMLLNALTRI